MARAFLAISPVLGAEVGRLNRRSGLSCQLALQIEIFVHV